MNERQLQSFLKAADLGSFSCAAAASFITTPAFVQQINLLEDSLGFKLFLRGRRGVALTEAGKLFYESAGQILSIYEDACRKCIALSGSEERTLNLGCPPEQFPQFVHEACDAFHRGYPDLRVNFVPSSLNQNLQDLRSGKIDLCFMAEPGEEALGGLVFTPLYDETFSFCMSRNHPLAERESLSPDDLTGYPVLCGAYDYLKLPMEQCLPPELDIHRLDAAYDSSTQSRSMFSDELIMIHAHWGNCYSGALRVVPSFIPAGRVGAVSRSPAPRVVTMFLACVPSEANPHGIQ